MAEAFEGDLVRPLGLVTLYAAYAEGEVDELLSVLPGPQPFDDAKRQWQVGCKLNYARSLIRKLKTSDLSGLLATLEDAKVLFNSGTSLSTVAYSPVGA